MLYLFKREPSGRPVTIPPRPPEYINFFKPFLFTASDQLVVLIGALHISSWLQEIQSREWEERTKNKILGLTQGAREELCNIAFPLCICRLTLAWISSEISTKLLGMPTHLDRFSFTGLDSLSCQLVTSAVRCRLATLVTLRQLPPSPSLCLTLWLAFPSYFQSCRDLESKPFVWFCAKTVKGIVCLADHLHSVTALDYGRQLYLFCLQYLLFLQHNNVQI